MGVLTKELQREKEKIQQIAESVGLDFFETVFELVTSSQLNEIAACGGFPVRYPHWRWGMEYERISKGYKYGLSKIYELVINNDPCYAYLMEGNELLDQKLVMAHVYGHSDFFKNNKWFECTDRKMLDTIASHATRIRRYQDIHGVDAVESFIDKCLSIENLIDPYGPYANQSFEGSQSQEEGEPSIAEAPHQHIDSFMKSMSDEEAKVGATSANKIEKDVLQFLIEKAPLENWQQQILSIIRAESYYFVPQGMTKIMNEGWASLWHSKMMTEFIMCDSEIVNFADRHSGAMVMTQGFNPYKVGIELFRNIQERWDRGQFGRDWDECNDRSAKANWDTKSGMGMEKIFQVRRNYNDVTFIDEFLTEDFCIQNKLFVYKFNSKMKRFEIDSRELKAIKSKLLFQLTNMGHPIISVIDSNFENREELLLNHLHEGVDLEINYMKETLKNIYAIWKRPVNVVTVISEERKVFKFDGSEHTARIFPEALIVG